MTQQIDPDPARSRRAVTHILARRGPTTRVAVIGMAARGGIDVGEGDILRLIRQGEVVAVRGADGAELIGLPVRGRTSSGRRLRESPPALLAALTIAAILALVLLALALNSASSSWPTIDWPPPPK